MNRALLAVCLALLVPLYAAQAQGGAADCPVPAKLDDGWTTATPQEAGFDPDKLCPLDGFVGRLPGAAIHGVVIVRHGKLVMERYYKGTLYRSDGNRSAEVEFGPTVKHGLASVSKSVISLLIGIARGEGKVADLDAPVIGHLPAQYADLRTSDKAHISIRNLLTMSSGFDWDERLPYSDPGNTAAQMLRAPDPYRFVLRRSVSFKPGEVYNYSSGDTELLGLVLANSVGQSVDAYARDKLFRPMGIVDDDWLRMPGNGQPLAAGGLRLRPRDMAKLGQLLLTDGQWNGRQILPRGWVAESTAPHIKALGYRYGYQWWLGRSISGGRDLPWIAGFGLGGQRLFVQPDSDLVVAITAGDYALPLRQQGSHSLQIFERHILPAITGP